MNAKPTPNELHSAIRDKCLECCGGSRKEVQRCNMQAQCALWPYRLAEPRERTKPMKGQVSLFELMPKEEGA